MCRGDRGIRELFRPPVAIPFGAVRLPSAGPVSWCEVGHLRRLGCGRIPGISADWRRNTDCGSISDPLQAEQPARDRVRGLSATWQRKVLKPVLNGLGTNPLHADRRRHQEADRPEEAPLPEGLPALRSEERPPGDKVQEVPRLCPEAEEQVRRAQEVARNPELRSLRKARIDPGPIV